MFSWSLSKPTGILIAISGYLNTYSASNADTVSVIVSLNTGNVILTDKIKLTILPAVQYHLCIETDETPNPVSADPIDTIALCATDSAKSAYLIIRDRNGNFVDFASELTISVNDTNIAMVEIADITIGRMIVRRSNLAGVTAIIVSQALVTPDTCYVKTDEWNPTMTYMRMNSRIRKPVNWTQGCYLVNGKRLENLNNGMSITIKTEDKKEIAPRIQLNK